MPRAPTDLVPGLHERVVTERLAEALEALGELAAQRKALDPGEAHLFLGRHLGGVLTGALRAIPERHRPEAQLRLVNRVLDVVRQEVPGYPDDPAGVRSELLLALTAPDPVTGTTPPPRPGIPLSQSALLVNAPGEHRIGVELARELDSADAVDLLVAFVKWSGFVRLRDALTRLTRRGRRLRVITTAYTGATDRRAVDALVALGAEVRVSYDTRRTRLHAKAWLFHRDSGFSTGYVGSSNLSHAALTEGLEWNVRLSQVDTSAVLSKFDAAFESYWDDPEFEPYDPERDAKRLDRALKDERPPDLGPAITFDLVPYPFQQEILERLESERVGHGRHKNLVVAATGTGKTLIAAFDYRRLAGGGRPPSLLFVAHRKEILKQSRDAFRAVLRDRTFGELFVDGTRPETGRHVFASVQSLANVDLGRLPKDRYDVVIVDEFHHAAADTYRRLLDHLKPRELLGLTATPERTDGESIFGWFDGRIAAELRLWEAIDRGLLSPFQYFGVADGTDLSGLTWRRGYVQSELDGVFTGDQARARRIKDALVDHVLDARRMRALGFCAGVAHAEFMARELTRLGIPSLALTGATPRDQRDASVGRLRRREVNALFTVDLFNEGVDIPEVDTLLFLRPTESATVFLQQLGRGLRLCPDKASVAVLDLVGRAHHRYRFDVRYRALTGGSRARLIRDVEGGFPTLPAGCSVQLEREAQAHVLANLKENLSTSTARLAEELRAAGPAGTVDLATFLAETGVELEDVYRNGRTWSALKRAAGLKVPDAGPDETILGRGLGRLLHLDDPLRLALYRKGLAAATPPLSLGDARTERLWLMLVTALLGPHRTGTVAAGLARLWAHPALCAELLEVLAVLEDRTTHVPRVSGLDPAVPLMVHAHYALGEIMAAFGIVGASGKVVRPQAGIYRDREGTNSDLLFITLNKSERDYSPTTMYEDYAISPTRFHWQSENTATPGRGTGKRYVAHQALGVTPLLFVREARQDARGATVPYLFLGPAALESHHGQRPMNIVWKLKVPMPADAFQVAKVAAG